MVLDGVLAPACHLTEPTRASLPIVRAQDVVLVHRRTFRRFCDVEQTLSQCNIGDGDVLELTIRFAAQPAATKLLEPVGFYEVLPRPASAGVPRRTEIAVHLVNVTVENRRCIVLRPAEGDVEEAAVPCMQIWQPPNVLKLVPSVALRADTLYSVTLDLNLDVPGVHVNHGTYDLSCVADGVDTVRPYVFVWHFQTGAVEGDEAVDRPAAASLQQPAEPGAPMLEVVQGLLSRPLDGFSKKQLVMLQANLSGMLDRVGDAITNIDQKIDTINRRLQEKSRRLNNGDRPGGDDADRRHHSDAAGSAAIIEHALKKIRHS